MKNDHVTDLLSDYLDGILKADSMQEVRSHLKQCEACSLEASELKKLLKAFENESLSSPSPKVRTEFLEQLEAEKKLQDDGVSMDTTTPVKRNPWAFQIMKIAAGVALMIAAFLAGKYQSEEITSQEIASLTEEKLAFKQSAMLSLLENESASKRIQGVNYIEDFVKLDDAIVKALIDRMLYDKNINVRLTAVEALGKFISSEAVKKAFIEALKIEKDPSVQITIIYALVAIQEKKAIAPMRKLLQQEETQPFIKSQIESLLPSII